MDAMGTANAWTKPATVPNCFDTAEFSAVVPVLSRSCSRETFITIKLVQTLNESLEWLHPHPKTTIFTGVFCCKSLPLPSELAGPLKPPLPQYRNPQGSLGWRSGRPSWHGSGSDDLQRFESFPPLIPTFPHFSCEHRDKLTMKLCWLVGFLFPKERWTGFLWRLALVFFSGKLGKGWNEDVRFP